MNQTETNVFFRALHALEDSRAAELHPDMTAEEWICQSPEYMEGYDYVMDVVRDHILDGEEVRNLTDLDNLINQVDAYAGDFSGEYGRGYQEAVNICLEALSQLITSEEV